MAYEICDYCKQHINVDSTSNDVVETEQGIRHYLHHHGCSRLYLMNHQLGEEHVRVIATNLRGKHVPRT